MVSCNKIFFRTLVLFQPTNLDAYRKIEQNHLQRGVDIQLPQEAAGKVDLSKGAVISIKKNKKIYLGKEIIPLDKLEKRLKDLYAKRKLREVFLRADKNLPYGFVVKAMAKIKNAGIQRLGMVTEFIE